MRAVLLGSFFSLAASNVSAQSCPSGSTDSIEQYGITFRFDRAYACGQFANGDYWVAPDAPGERVRITAIDPAYAGERNGFEVNPSSGSAHGFDGRADGFDARLVPALPYDAAPGDSIVKTTSTGGSECRLEVSGSFFLTCLYDAVVLTVLDAPADRTTLFRPPYFGDDKPSFSAATMDLSWLPELASIPESPGAGWVLERYGRVQLDHKEDFTGRSIHPYNNLPDYGSDIGRDAGDAALALMLEADDAERRAAIIAFVQAGIDLFAMRRAGLVFSNGTHGLGRKLMLSFAARALGEPEMRALVADAEDGTYGEDTLLTWGEAAGRILWGMPCSEDQYWMTILTGTGSRFCADPYGYIDGGDGSAATRRAARRRRGKAPRSRCASRRSSSASGTTPTSSTTSIAGSSTASGRSPIRTRRTEAARWTPIHPTAPAAGRARTARWPTKAATGARSRARCGARIARPRLRRATACPRRRKTRGARLRMPHGGTEAAHRRATAERRRRPKTTDADAARAAAGTRSRSCSRSRSSA
jgi:hypothetical protein